MIVQNPILKIKKVKDLERECIQLQRDADSYYNEHADTDFRYFDLPLHEMYLSDLDAAEDALDVALNELTATEKLAAGYCASTEDVLKEAENEFNKDIKGKVAFAVLEIHEPQELLETHAEWLDINVDEYAEICTTQIGGVLTDYADGQVSPGTGMFELKSIALCRNNDESYTVDFEDNTVEYENAKKNYSFKWIAPELEILNRKPERDIADSPNQLSWDSIESEQSDPAHPEIKGSMETEEPDIGDE